MRQLSKGIFPSGNFPTVKFPKLQLPAAALGPYPALAAALGPPLQPAAPRSEGLT